jgi:hypothetical protein
METHIIGALQEWKTEGKSPTQAFQQIVKHIGKFYSVYSSVMPISSTAV